MVLQSVQHEYVLTSHSQFTLHQQVAFIPRRKTSSVLDDCAEVRSRCLLFPVICSIVTLLNVSMSSAILFGLFGGGVSIWY
jgi:hypothetical protein